MSCSFAISLKCTRKSVESNKDPYQMDGTKFLCSVFLHPFSTTLCYLLYNHVTIQVVLFPSIPYYHSDLWYRTLSKASITKVQIDNIDPLYMVLPLPTYFLTFSKKISSRCLQTRGATQKNMWLVTGVNIKTVMLIEKSSAMQKKNNSSLQALVRISHSNDPVNVQLCLWKEF